MRAATVETPRGTHQPSSRDIQQFVPLVREVVRRMLRRLPPNVRRDDLLSAGLVGLYDSMRRNGGHEGPKFEWYARTRIRGAILDELRSQDWLPRRARWVAAGRRPPADGAPAAPTAVVGLDDLGADERAAHLTDAVTPGAEDQVEARRARASLLEAVDSLPERERTIVRLHYFEGARFQEIGALLGVSEPRVSQLHARAIGRLRASLAREQAA